MAKTSVVEREKKREKLIKQYAKKRAQLKATICDLSINEEDRWTAQQKLQLLPRNSCPVRQHNRCKLTGRSRGVYRKFGLARNMLRIYAMRGEIPGLVKASW